MRTLTHKILPLSVVFVLLVLLMPGSAKFVKEYRTGAPWKHETLVAQFDFPILKTEEQMAGETSEETGTGVIPVYVRDAGVLTSALDEVSALNIDGAARSAVGRALVSIFEKGVRPEDGPELPSASTQFIYVSDGKALTKRPASEVYDTGSARAALLKALSGSYAADSLLRASGAGHILKPKLVFDLRATEAANENTGAALSPTCGFVKAGQVIVNAGETVTAEIAQTLDSYRQAYNETMGLKSTPLRSVAGNALVALGILAFLLLSIHFTNPRIFDDRGKYHYILTIVTLAAALTLIIIRVDGNLLFYLPFTLFAILLQEFFLNREILVIYVVSLLPLLIFADNGMPLFVMYLTAGAVAIQMCRFYARGWKQFVLALFTFAVLAVLCLAFHLTGVLSGNILHTLTKLFVASLLTVAGYTTVFLFERMFNLVSTARLAELCDSTTPLLHELEQKAPGTFQHSLQVMNMADAAARSIGADCRLIRAGALYHDIGKLRNPMCFVENESMQTSESGARYHSDISALQSATDIIRHVSDGVEIAAGAGLPEVVVDFIRTHHGTTRVTYFLDKYEKEGGDSANFPKFSYEGPVPSSKEQIILMLCDSIEAASRTLKDYSPASIDTLVEDMFTAKTAQGQFGDADITIREMGIVKNAIKNYLASIYHKRIVYPTNNRTHK